MQTKNSDGGCGTPSHQQFEGEKSKCPMSEHVMGNVSQLDDPFTALRQGDGVLDIDDQGDPVKMVLGLKDVRKAAHSWQLFQSGAIPGRIVVPSEVAIRDVRQLPFELDPPAHKGFRGATRALVQKACWESLPRQTD